MNRLVLFVLPLIALLGLSLTGTADAATAKTYTVTRTVGGTTGQELIASVGGYELSIAGLQPYPETTTPIPSTDYRVTVSVSRD